MDELISKEMAIEALENTKQNDPFDRYENQNIGIEWAIDALKALPSAQPEIIRCRNCKFASGDSRICMKFGHSPIGELDFCAWAERRTDG